MHAEEPARDHLLVGAIAAVISVNAFLYLLWRDQTFVLIDAIAHVNKGRGLFDNFQPGLRALGTVWLPLPHILIAPLTAIDVLWTTGAAGSFLSIGCFVGTSIFLFLTGYEWTGSRIVGWLAFLLFALNPRLIYLFTTPLGEPLTIFCATGLVYYLMRWTQDQQWTDFALAALMVFAGTLTRYEGWALAAAATALIPILARKQRMVCTILFAGAACAGPMLWMLFNMVYFDDPLMFMYGAGSAQAYSAADKSPIAGKLWSALATYFIDVAYCLNPGVLWLALGGVLLSVIFIGRRYWRPTMLVVSSSAAVFGWYVLNLYFNIIPIYLPGMIESDPQKVGNVRYGSVMAATLPLFAALFIFIVWRQVERRRVFSLFMFAPLVLARLVLPNPIPRASDEPVDQQLTNNLFYTEAIHNQGFWMPPFVEVSKKLKEDINGRQDDTSMILTNTRIVHVVVWATGIPMRRFMTEMHDHEWGVSLTSIDSRVRWAITEEGDQLWHGQGEWLKKNWVEVAVSKTPSTARVHLYRRPD